MNFISSEKVKMEEIKDLINQNNHLKVIIGAPDNISLIYILNYSHLHLIIIFTIIYIANVCATPLETSNSLKCPVLKIVPF